MIQLHKKCKYEFKMYAIFSPGHKITLNMPLKSVNQKMTFLS